MLIQQKERRVQTTAICTDLDESQGIVQRGKKPTSEGYILHDFTMENSVVAARGYVGGRVEDIYGYRSGTEDPGDGTVLYTDCSGGHTDPCMIKLHRTTHTHINKYT